MVLIGLLGEDTDVQRCLLQPPPADLGRCLHQRDAARQINKPGRCQAPRPKESLANGGDHHEPHYQRSRAASLGHRGEALLGSATASIAKLGRFGDDFSGYGEQTAGISGSELATMNRGAGVEQHRSRLATFVLFTAGNGDGHTLKDDDNAASSEENATGTTEKIRKSEEQDKERCKLQTLEYVRGREQEGSNLAELTHRPGGAREASQNPQTKEKIGVVERRKHSKEQADEDDGDETQTEVSFEGSGVEVEGVDDMEQRGERQGVLGMQEELALFAEYKEYGGPRMGGVDTMLEGDGVGHTLGGEPAGRSAQRTTPAQQLGEPSEEDEPQPAGEFDGMVAVRVQYGPEEEDVLNIFLTFFRKMFGGMFEVDRENYVVSMTGQGKGNMPLKTARCLEHALRVCRENEFQALPGEDARGPNKHLILGGNVPAGATLGHLSNNYGIVVDKVEPEVLNFPALHANCAGARSSRSGSWEEKVAPGGEGPNLLPPPSYSVPPWSGPGERVKVVQLWGLTHCVNPAYERLVAVKSNQWKQCLRLGACDVLSLGKSVRMRQNSATVKLNEVLGVLSVEGNPIDVDGLFSRMVGFLSSNLPNSLATVDMINAGVMRHLATPCALPAIAEEAKVHMNLISLVPWWQKTQMLVLVPGGGRDPEVLRKVCGALHRMVMRWCDRNVSILLWPALIANAEQATDRKREGNSKDLRHAFATSISEAAGIDLWLDGFHLRGMVADAADHEAAQARLEEQKANLLSRLGMKDEVRKRTSGKATNAPPKAPATTVYAAPTRALSPRNRLGHLEASPPPPPPPLPLPLDASDECDPRRHLRHVYHHRHEQPGSRQYYHSYQRPSMAATGVVPFFHGGPAFPSCGELAFGDVEGATRCLGHETQVTVGSRGGEYMVPSLTAEPAAGSQTVQPVTAEQHHVHHHHVHHYHHYQQPTTHTSEAREHALHGPAPISAQEVQQFPISVVPQDGAGPVPVTYHHTHQQEQTPQAMLAQQYSSSPYYTVQARAGGGANRTGGRADGCQVLDGSQTGGRVRSSARQAQAGLGHFLSGSGVFVQEHYKDCGGGGGGGGGGWLQG